ncbi:hypothetical protein C5167_003128 [Papaver somniferum]|uniref:protein-serine/threonine phosphatase n=1 Tax=Papaver somniferum TaxID=3469 RepID=A0A4Y7L3J3_PAPSO|nr:hypothetical protein C5167_003128 [Papaver somniferum]
MAEICCGIMSESKTQSTCDQPSRAARRKRMEIRKFKFIAGNMVEEELKENGGIKRQKRSFIEETTISSLSPARECENGVESIDYENHSSSNESTVETISILKSSSPVANIPVAMIPVVEDRCPKFGMSSVCGRRRDMEDAVSIHPSFCKPECEIPAWFHFFGVYDGHGCSHVATSCKQRLHQVVKEEIENGCKEESDLKWESIMKKSFIRVDREVTEWSSSSNTSSLLLNASCRCELQTPKCDAVGSTAVVSVVTPDKIIVSNCGDSRAVLCRGGKAVPLSVDHKPKQIHYRTQLLRTIEDYLKRAVEEAIVLIKLSRIIFKSPDRPDELVRIQEAGGRVIYWDGPRVLGVLAMSRAIGDNYLKPYVISEPEITVTDRTAEDDCMILASDGLWDVVSNETACNIAGMCLNGQGPIMPLTNDGDEANMLTNGSNSSDKACSDAALLLTKLALARHSTDNVSVVVVNLRKET